jgi:hypothetical protein
MWVVPLPGWDTVQNIVVDVAGIIVIVIEHWEACRHWSRSSCGTGP